MKRLTSYLMLSALLIVQTACGDGSLIQSENSAVAHQHKNTQDAGEAMTVERKLIKTGTVAFVSKDTDATRKRIYELTDRYKGYVSGDEQSGMGEDCSNSVSVRVPSDQFDHFLMEVLKGVDQVDSKNIRIDDVTEEYVDVEARVKAKKALEERFIALLEQAKTVKEVLEVEEQIGTIREEIESVEGRLRYLENSVSFSTVHLHFYSKTALMEDHGPDFGESAGAGWDNLLAFLAGLLRIWPFILLVGIGLFLFRRWYKRRKVTES